MRRGRKSAIIRGWRMIIACVLSNAVAYGQAVPEPKPQMAEEVFKNL